MYHILRTVTGGYSNASEILYRRTFHLTPDLWSKFLLQNSLDTDARNVLTDWLIIVGVTYVKTEEIIDVITTGQL